MPTLTIRNVPEQVHQALRLRAAENARSVEAEVRSILAAAVAQPSAHGVREERRAFVHDEDLPSAIGLWGTYPEGRLASEDFIASRRLEAAYEGDEITPEEFGELNRRLDAFEIDLPWVEAFLEERRRNAGR